MQYLYVHDNDIHIVFRYLVPSLVLRCPFPRKKQALLSGGMVAAVAALHV